MGYQYVISDLHGNYDKYIQVFDTIKFCDDDTLFVLGDVVDRGDQPIKILQDMMVRPNVVPLIGNHEVFALKCLRLLTSEITEQSITQLQSGDLEILLEWSMQGGRSTIDDFVRLSYPERQSILEYLGEFSLYEELYVNGEEYVLVHGGLQNFDVNKAIDEYTPEEILFDRPDYSKIYFPDKFLVTGHTPTRTIKNNPNPDYIYRANRHIAMDCGCAWGGNLGIFRFNDGKEFYI